AFMNSSTRCNLLFLNEFYCSTLYHFFGTATPSRSHFAQPFAGNRKGPDSASTLIRNARASSGSRQAGTGNSVTSNSTPSCCQKRTSAGSSRSCLRGCSSTLSTGGRVFSVASNDCCAFCVRDDSNSSRDSCHCNSTAHWVPFGLR